LTISSSADLNGVGALTANAPGKSVTVSGIIGPGTYGGAATTEGVGTLAIGTSAQNENLSLGATSIYNWGVSASGQGLISVAGNVSIASGAEVLVHNAGQGSPATSYTILTWTGSGPSIVPTTVAYAAPPSGTTVNWTGGGSPSSAWSTATNWDLGSYTGGVLTKTSSSLILSGLTVVPTTPVSTSAVVIAPAGGVAVTGPSAATTVNSLTIGNGTDATSLAVQSSGPFTVTNALTLNNNATLAGPGTVNAASLNLLSGSASLSGGVSVSAPAVTVNGTANFGSSTITTGTMAVNGTANLNAGSTLAITSLSGSGAVNFNGGAVQAASNLTLSGGPNTVVQSGGAVFNTNGNTITLSQALTHGSASAVDGGLTVQGGGNLVVNTAQSYTGPTVISGGILQLSGLVVTPGLNVEFVGGNDTTAISQQSTFNAWLPTQQLYLQTTTVANSSAHARINYPDVGNSFSDLGFNSSNSSIPSGVDLQNNFTISMTGDLTITNGGSYNFGTNSDDGSMVWIDGNLVVNNNNYQGMGGNRSDPATVQQQGSIYLTAGVHTIQIGYYQGGGGYGLNVSYSGADTLTDTGSPETNDNGWVFLPNSVLSVITQRATTNILPVTSALTVATTATLDLNGDSQQLASLAGGGTITNSNSGSPVVLTLSNTGSTTTFSGSIIDGAAPGGVSLVISGSGTQVLSGSNTYSGGTTVQSGTLILDGASSLLAGSSLVIGSAPSGGGIILPNSVSSPRSSPTLAPVPEPGTMALLCVGALMVLGYRLRRRLGD
jgi:autotransporter-associated beta strand protein